MEIRRPSRNESLRKIVTPLVIAGALTAVGAIADMNFSAVKGRYEAESFSLPNTTPEQLATERSLRESELFNKTLKRGLLEFTGALALVGSAWVIESTTRENKRNQNGTQNLQFPTT